MKRIHRRPTLTRIGICVNILVVAQRPPSQVALGETASVTTTADNGNTAGAPAGSLSKAIPDAKANVGLGITLSPIPSGGFQEIHPRLLLLKRAAGCDCLLILGVQGNKGVP